MTTLLSTRFSQRLRPRASRKYWLIKNKMINSVSIENDTTPRTLPLVISLNLSKAPVVSNNNLLDHSILNSNVVELISELASLISPLYETTPI